MSEHYGYKSQLGNPIDAHKYADEMFRLIGSILRRVDLRRLESTASQ